MQSVHAVNGSSMFILSHFLVRISMKFRSWTGFFSFFSHQDININNFCSSWECISCVYQTSNIIKPSILQTSSTNGTWVLMGQKYRSPKSDLQQGDLALQKRFTIRFGHVLPWVVRSHMFSTCFRFPNMLRCAMLHGTHCSQILVNTKSSGSAFRSAGRGTWPESFKASGHWTTTVITRFRKANPEDSLPPISGFCLMPPRKS